VSEEDAVLAAYRGYWATILDLGGLVPTSERLDRYATGPALARSSAAIANQRAVGQYVEVPAGANYRHDATVTSVLGDEAVVADCAVDDGLLLAKGSNLVLDDSVTTRQLTARVTRSGGTWRVEDVTTIREWEGVSGCAG